MDSGRGSSSDFPSVIQGIVHSSDLGVLGRPLRRLLREHKAAERSTEWLQENYVLTVSTLVHAVSDSEARQFLCRGAQQARAQATKDVDLQENRRIYQEDMSARWGVASSFPANPKILPTPKQRPFSVPPSLPTRQSAPPTFKVRGS